MSPFLEQINIDLQAGNKQCEASTDYQFKFVNVTTCTLKGRREVPISTVFVTLLFKLKHISQS